MRLFTADSLYERNEKKYALSLHMCTHSTTIGPIENVTNDFLKALLFVIFNHEGQVHILS